jgi:hypothetical protein
MNLLVVIIGAVAVIGAAGWFACGGWTAVGTTYEDDADSPVAIDEIRIDGKTVAVEVRPGPDTGVRIHRTARYLNPLHGRPGQTHRVVGKVLELGGDDSTAFSVIEYVVVAPPGVRVTATIGTGSLDAIGVSTVDARISTGSVRIADATGVVTAHVGTGSITTSRLHADVVAATGTGAVSLDLAAPADVEARAGTGSVDVTVPADAYAIEASTGMGALNLGIASDPQAPHHLTLRSDMGRVSLATR